MWFTIEQPTTDHFIHYGTHHEQKKNERRKSLLSILFMVSHYVWILDAKWLLFNWILLFELFEITSLLKQYQ